MLPESCRTCECGYMPIRSNEVGERILATATSVAREVLGPHLSAVFAMGSLAHGGFAPLTSDIDMALIVRDLTDDTAGFVAEVRQLTVSRVHTPLADRLSIFWTDWDGVRHGATVASRLATVDRLDLLDDGRLLYGSDERASAVRPDRTAVLVEVATFAIGKFDHAYLAELHRPERLVAEGPRAASKAALFPIRMLYTLDSGRFGQNPTAVSWYEHHGSHPDLARAAAQWRSTGIKDAARAISLLRTSLVDVYDEFLTAYAAALADTGSSDLAAGLLDMRNALHSLEA